mmetsp:Transcript_6243/g.22195  ORF Transcript_6243/g.22195 Transcript_6243/m.22195 type:complete len:320 (-) Transcript_6243:192-1151(-)
MRRRFAWQPMHCDHTIHCRAGARIRGARYSAVRRAAVFMKGRRCHSSSASRSSTVPSATRNGRISKRGPHSCSVTSDARSDDRSFSYVWCRKEIKSRSFAKVMTRLEPSLGTGNRCLSTVLMRSPSCVEKPWKMRCGCASETEPTPSMSCRITTLLRLKCTVGPNGRWLTISASGSPRVSLTTTRSEKPPRLQASTTSAVVWPPRFTRCAPGNSSRTSFANCFSRLLGECDVVTHTRGSATPASAYSSSSADRAARPTSVAPSAPGRAPVAPSSASISRRSSASCPRSSVGIGRPSRSASRTACFASYLERASPSRPRR